MWCRMLAGNVLHFNWRRSVWAGLARCGPLSTHAQVLLKGGASFFVRRNKEKRKKGVNLFPMPRVKGESEGSAKPNPLLPYFFYQYYWL